MAQLKDLIVNGPARFIGTIFGSKIQFKELEIPISSGSSTYGPGNNEQVLMSNGTTVYWGEGGSSLPDVTSSDNGKVLMVVNGVWTVSATLPAYDGSVT